MSEACKTQHIANRRVGYSGGVSGSRPDISYKGFERERNPMLEIVAGENPATHADTSDLNNGYKQFRGKCKELSEQLVAQDPTLKLVRGHYYCHAFGKQPHWWCERKDGTIVDPSARQFPSNGYGVYEPFNGIVECANCGKGMSEDEIRSAESNYVFCSTSCHMRFVGL